MATFNSEDLFLSRAKFVMKYMGVWIQPLNESLLSKCYRYLMVTLQYMFLIFQLIYIFQVWGDMEAIVQASYLMFTQSCLCFKVAIFLFNPDNIRQLIAQMNSEIFKPQNLVHQNFLRDQATWIKRMLMGFMISAQCTCVLWAVRPLFDGIGRKFPFDMWMPLSPESSLQYIIGYVFQLMTISMSASMYFGVDSVAMPAVMFACAQVQIIKDKILRVSPVTLNVKAADRQKLFEDNHKRLNECIQQHQAVYTFTKLVEQTFHAYLLFQMSGCVGIFCMTSLRMLGIGWRSVQFFSSLTYMLVMFTQLFVCCKCGHELTSMTEELHREMYKCSWYEQDLNFKRKLCFTMMRMSRPIVIRAGYYIPLSRQTFVGILRMSYSYFAVLNQANRVEQQ
uniref:Odorant receptor n=1 Tax=Heortia vitessoides TaxID=1557813 RepID=A0A3G6V6P8_9NEOP|nr:olfactory receptor 4 [Heortia vitessoides]